MSNTEQRAEDEEMDDYGNPVSGERLINCCFPDCGCDGARLCNAESGPSMAACSLNIERGTDLIGRALTRATTS